MGNGRIDFATFRVRSETRRKKTCLDHVDSRCVRTEPVRPSKTGIGSIAVCKHCDFISIITGRGTRLISSNTELNAAYERVSSRVKFNRTTYVTLRKNDTRFRLTDVSDTLRTTLTTFIRRVIERSRVADGGSPSFDIHLLALKLSRRNSAADDTIIPGEKHARIANTGAGERRVASRRERSANARAL